MKERQKGGRGAWVAENIKVNSSLTIMIKKIKFKLRILSIAVKICYFEIWK